MSTMQSRYYEDRFVVGRFIADRANALGLTRRELVERLGYRDRLAKGHKVLAEILLTGMVPRDCTSLAAALEIDETVLDAVLYTTARQQEAERQQRLLARESVYLDRFVPHLQIKTERRIPSPIFVAALLTADRLRIVYLHNDINSIEEADRDEIVQHAILKHYRDSSGHVPAFGRVEGYYFVRFAGFGSVDFGIPYDCFGSRIGSLMKVRRVPEGSLGLKKSDTRLTGLFKDSSITIVHDVDDNPSL